MDDEGLEWITVKGTTAMVLKPPAPRCRQEEEEEEEGKKYGGGGERERGGERGGKEWRSCMDPGSKKLRHQVDWRRGEDRMISR